jgi:hypothetical protein
MIQDLKKNITGLDQLSQLVYQKKNQTLRLPLAKVKVLLAHAQIISSLKPL